MSWWHLYSGTCIHDMGVEVIMGASTMHPNDVVIEGHNLLRVNNTFCIEKCPADLHYKRSWDHDPTDDERAQARTTVEVLAKPMRRSNAGEAEEQGGRAGEQRSHHGP